MQKDAELIPKLRRQLARQASVLVVGDVEPADSLFASWLGRVRVALPGEKWPIFRGRYMTPLCQINCAELPYRPEILSDIALIAVFYVPDLFPYDRPDGRANGDAWLLRAYPTFDGLAPLRKPIRRFRIKPVPVRWELVEDDYPAREDFYDFFEMPYPPPDNFDDYFAAKFPLELIDEYPELFETYSCSKVGGWPDLIQHRLSHEHPAKPTFVFQIAEEAKARLSWVDAGVAYFARGIGQGRDEWFANCDYW